MNITWPDPLLFQNYKIEFLELPLTQLMCGSEGTLGIITKIVFKLRGYPKKNVLMMIPFSTNEEACRAIAAIYVDGITPSGMEFFEKEAARKHLTIVRRC